MPSNVADMEIYFLRHGETEWNKDHRIQGSTEWTDLTDDGVRRAEATRDGMIAKGLAFDRIFSSPYRRAMHTAQILGEGFGLRPVVDDRLREISFGPYEGTRYGKGLFEDENIRACFVDPPRYVARDGAEPFDSVLARVRAFVDEILVPLVGTCSRVLVVAHGGVLRTVLRLTGNLSLAEFWQGSQPNCCAHVCSLEGGSLSLKCRATVFAGSSRH